MAQASATWTDTVEGDWEPGKLVHVDKVLKQFLQNIEHISQTHDHTFGVANDGGALKFDVPQYYLFYTT